ncbi:hypothetical protein BC834DRAFT_930033 [Gloeopeniophorella convolvens]|nr:hypothetical protein BC834DRAFT_930033 [Gloeopeniophorella convolvens]
MAASPSGPDAPSSSRPLPPDSADPALSVNRPRRPRKDKPRIELAPDQPPTTQGHPRTRVFVACVQCRGRKIRCDGAKPACFNCSQRAGNEECSYDAAPKRRGPDRIQGARTRTARPKEGDGEAPKRRRRRPTTNDQDAITQAAGGSYSIRRPSVTTGVSALDTLGDPTAFTYSQQSAVSMHPMEQNVIEPPGSNMRFTSTTSYDQSLAYESLRDRHPGPSVRNVDYNADIGYPAATTVYGDAIPTAYMVPAEDRGGDEQEIGDITPDPSVQFSRKIWWDHLLYLYTVSVPGSYGTLPLGQPQRDASTNQIVEDVRFIFRSSSYWFSFFNVPRFYGNFMDPARRSRMQPSLLLSLLAVSTFLQSPERQHPEESRRMALLLRNEAQGALEASLNSRAIDEELAQAAWILSFFEVCAHPQHQSTRVQSALNILDGVIRTLAMTHLDAAHPATSKFAPHDVPIVEDVPPAPHPSTHYASTTYYLDSLPVPLSSQQSSQQYMPQQQQQQHQQQRQPQQRQQQQQQPFSVAPTAQGSGCSCDGVSLGCQWPESQKQVPLWMATPAWNYSWSEGEIKKEECRRLCWSTLMLVSGHTSYIAAANGRLLDLFVLEPSNYLLLFPGEALLPAHPQPFFHATGGKDTVWALYIRAMLLWNGCLRLRSDTSLSDAHKADLAMRAWMETEAIEKALARHTCSVERAFMYNGREYLFNTRMCISYEFQRFIPHVLIGVNREKSEEWLRAQGKRAKTVMLGMHAVTGNIKHNLAQRPWFVWWFMGQISRALTLWQLDNSLTVALDVCKAFLEPIEFLTSIYPCPEQRVRFDGLRERLRHACHAAEATGEYVPTPVEMLYALLFSHLFYSYYSARRGCMHLSFSLRLLSFCPSGARVVHLLVFRVFFCFLLY